MQLGWCVMEKEAFAFTAILQNMHWHVAIASVFNLHTDQNNLVLYFDPLSLVPDLSQTFVWNVVRWAVTLGAYDDI